MIQSTSLEIFCASSPTKSRSNEGNKIPSYLEEKDGNLLDQLVTSSIASSGYWEDCDSLVTSEYDVFGVNWAYCHHNERIKSFKSKHSSLTEGAVESPSVRARSFNVRQTSAPGKTSLVGDFTADRQSYPTFYADCKELQLLNLSHNNDSNSVRLSSEDNGCVSLKNDSLDGFDSITSDLLPCDKVTLRNRILIHFKKYLRRQRMVRKRRTYT
ncbi:unnamed protein product [Heterobilharzia americana]|nr:unnamed protein product [Heterobilharzia americana]